MRRRFAILAVSIFALAACKLKPTFPEAKIASDLQRMLAKEYKLNVETRYTGGSLQTHVYKVGLLRGETDDLQGLAPDSLKSLQDVLLCATRIALSTDAKLQFIEIRLADVLTGSSLTIWRYVPDITGSMRQSFGEMEYFSRLVVDIQEGERDPKTSLAKRTLLGQVKWNTPMTLSEFIARQVIMRARREGAQRLRIRADLSDPETLGMVIENWASVQGEGAEEANKMTDVMHRTAQSVVKGYRFAGFRELVLRDGRGLALQRWAF